MTLPIPEIRQYLTNAYSDDELGTLCADYFRDVYEDFAAGMTKAQKIGLLLDYCQRRDQLPNLCAALKRDRPQQYPVHFAGDIVEVRPAVPQPQRDSRQVFISHAHEDTEFARRLASDLQGNGWRVWIAPDSIRPGEKWAEAINRGLEESGVFVVALTPAAVASNWVKIETNLAIELAQRDEIRFIPLFVSECRPPVLWTAFQRILFSGRYPAGLADLLAALDQREVKPQSEPTVPTAEPQPRLKWLWLAAGGAVLLMAAIVLALIIRGIISTSPVLPPNLSSPLDGEAQSEKVTFSWQPASSLPANAAYELVWWVDGAPAATAKPFAETTTDPFQELDLSSLAMKKIRWTVLVVQPKPHKRLTQPTDGENRLLAVCRMEQQTCIRKGEDIFGSTWTEEYVCPRQVCP